MSNIRTTILSVVLVLILTLSVRLVTARTDVVSVHPNDSAAVMENQQSTNQNKAPIGLYRPPREVCLDAPLGGAVTCPIERPSLVRSYRSPLDECFDVSLTDLSACRAASQATIQVKDPAIDECFDVSISELASCRSASQAPAP